MRTTPALRILAAALLTGGTLAAAAAGTTAAAAPPAHAEGTGADGHSGGSIRGTVVSRTDLNLRQSPTTHSPVVGTLPPGSHDRVQCKVLGQSVNGNPYWYWLTGARAWASAAFIDTGGVRVPTCADPCPQWKNGDWANWDDSWANSAWSVAATGSFSISGSWSFAATGTSSGVWDWLPIVR